MIGVLIKMGNLDMDMHIGKTPCKDEGRDWGDASKSSKLRERRGQILLHNPQ